ncbi:MAG: flavoprotein [Gemmataceae bacterium]
MANVLLGVTGSVASIRTPELLDQFTGSGHSVKVIATHASLYFFDPTETVFSPLSDGTRNPDIVILDEDEWPGMANGRRWQRKEPVLHIELRRWADIFVVAPIDANTLAKVAYGLADNCLTCVWRAWDRTRPVVVAPAMNTHMWDHPATIRHLRQLAQDAGMSRLGDTRDALELIHRINESEGLVRIVPPVSKRLACDDIGMGAMNTVEVIVNTVTQVLNEQLS